MPKKLDPIRVTLTPDDPKQSVEDVLEEILSRTESEYELVGYVVTSDTATLTFE
jgi:F420-0:gamma-glutamyl ligase